MDYDDVKTTQIYEDVETVTIVQSSDDIAYNQKESTFYNEFEG